MFNPLTVKIDAFVARLESGYRSTYGGWKANYAEIIGSTHFQLIRHSAWAGNIALEIIGNSNALYHNVDHTMFVTLVGQEILRGLHIRRGGVSCETWLNAVISLLFHDIGYVRGICRADDEERNYCSTGKSNEVIEFSLGSTDACLAPYHVDRGKQFIRERFGSHSLINSLQIQKNIELTLFPLPAESADETNFSVPEIVRAADLIGQIGDPGFVQKAPALFYEFEEIGANDQFGYDSPTDLVNKYPTFFWNAAYKFIRPAIQYLKVTTEGKNILASLYSNVFAVEHSTVLMEGANSEQTKVVRSPLFQRRRTKPRSARKKRISRISEDDVDAGGVTVVRLVGRDGGEEEL